MTGAAKPSGHLLLAGVATFLFCDYKSNKKQLPNPHNPYSDLDIQLQFDFEKVLDQLYLPPYIFCHLICHHAKLDHIQYHKGYHVLLGR